MTDQAAYGSKMNWQEQRRKQEELARERDARLHGEIINDEEKVDEIHR